MDKEVFEVVKLARAGKMKEALRRASKLNNSNLNRFLAGRATIHPITGEFQNQTNWWDKKNVKN